MIRLWSIENNRKGVVKAPAPPGCEMPTRLVSVAIESEEGASASSDDEESLSTLYETEEEPLFDDVNKPSLLGDDVMLVSATSSTLTITQSNQDSFDNEEKISEKSNYEVNQQLKPDSKSKKVFRRLPDESSFLGEFIRGKIKLSKNSQFFNRHKPKANAMECQVESSSFDQHRSFFEDISSLNASQTSLISGEHPETPRPPHFVVVAIDFGTTFSGYAFSFLHQSNSVHLMRKWSGGDPGLNNQKTPTIVLLNPSGSFHSFGFEARDFYHDLDSTEAHKWIYLERFKMKLHNDQNLSKATQLLSSNGTSVSALLIFSYALRFFKQHALQELSDELGTPMKPSDIRWVVTVPAIWRPQAKQFMRQAAYQAGLASERFPEQLVIALEPEVASIFCKKSRYSQLQDGSADERRVEEGLTIGNQYMVLDCGGGTVDVTIHEVLKEGGVKEVEAASGGNMGSVAVDLEFEKLLQKIFGVKFIESFKQNRPVGWVDLMIAWESRKRSTSPDRVYPLNVALPFSFIDLHGKFRGFSVETAVRNFNNDKIKWSPQGMLRMSASLMHDLFKPVLDKITSHVMTHMNDNISHLFLVGGFAESQMLQKAIKRAVGGRAAVIIPPDASLTILKGAVLFGLDPALVRMRRSHMTYGVGVLNKFDPSLHPLTKKLVRGNQTWCKDVFDSYVIAGEAIALGDVVQRSYTPVRWNQKELIINFYCCPRSEVTYVDEKDVKKCATIRIKLPDLSILPSRKRELRIAMMFGDTEIKIDCIDVTSGSRTDARANFLL